MREFFISLFWPTLAGVLAAIIVLDQWVLPEPTARQAGGPANSYSEAVARATPSVVNIYTAKLVDSGRSPRFNDPLLRRFLAAAGRRQCNNSRHLWHSGHIIKCMSSPKP